MKDSVLLFARELCPREINWDVVLFAKGKELLVFARGSIALPTLDGILLNALTVVRNAAMGIDYQDLAESVTFVAGPYWVIVREERGARASN